MATTGDTLLATGGNTEGGRQRRGLKDGVGSAALATLRQQSSLLPSPLAPLLFPLPSLLAPRLSSRSYPPLPCNDSRQADKGVQRQGSSPHDDRSSPAVQACSLIRSPSRIQTRLRSAHRLLPGLSRARCRRQIGILSRSTCLSPPVIARRQATRLAHDEAALHFPLMNSLMIGCTGCDQGIQARESRGREARKRGSRLRHWHPQPRTHARRQSKVISK